MLIKKDPDLIKAYLEDYSNMKGGFCDSVLFPETEQEVSSILRSASRSKSPVTVSGAGTGVTGARIPFGGKVLSVEKMNRILSIEKLASGGGTAFLEPGVALEDFLNSTEEQNLFYPPNPTEKSSFIGGNVATSASGARSFRFGTTRDYVLGLRIVLSTGDILEIERGKVFAGKDRNISLPLCSGNVLKLKIPGYRMPDVKNAAGYYVKDGMDAIDLFIGQEGTLGVVTRVKLRLLEGLGSLLDCYAFFNREEDALSFVYKARDISLAGRSRKRGLNAISLEFFDKNALGLLRERHKNIPSDVKGAVYFEQETGEEAEPEILDSWANLIRNNGGSLDNTWFAQTKKERQALESVRHDLPDIVNEFMKRHGIVKIGSDMAVGPENIDYMIRYYKELLAGACLRYVIFGHIGESHLHVNILPENKNQCDKAKRIYNLFVKKALSFKGTVTAEHGIGKVKHIYLEMMYGKEGLKEMGDLKKSLDPQCILGLDNIFPKELLK